MCSSAAFFFFPFSPLFRAACQGAHSALACGCCWRVSVSDVVFMFSVESNFRLLGVFLRGRQPADPQADRPAGESAAIPSVEVCTSEVPTHFALLGGHLAQPLGPARHFLDLIFCVSVVFQSHFSGSCSSFSRFLSGLVLVFIHADPVLAISS